MESLYSRIRDRARQIVASHPLPDFYTAHPSANERSRRIFDSDELVNRLSRFIRASLDDDFGHGWKHSAQVALDAAALIYIEGRSKGWPQQSIARHMQLAQCAGLLHDIRRKRQDHARYGARYAQRLLRRFPLSEVEIEGICAAIRDHEAFKPRERIVHPPSALLANCLYDADKFRWGPDNFTDTVWDMLTLSNIPLASFIERYPKGLERIAHIRDTFRTASGQRYGPQFIDIGLAVGQTLWQVLLDDFGHLIEVPPALPNK